MVWVEGNFIWLKFNTIFKCFEELKLCFVRRFSSRLKYQNYSPILLIFFLCMDFWHCQAGKRWQLSVSTFCSLSWSWWFKSNCWFLHQEKIKWCKIIFLYSRFNRTALNILQCRKTAVLSCYRCLTNTVLKKWTTFKYRLELWPPDVSK
jgi:hypothetical protein